MIVFAWHDIGSGICAGRHTTLWSGMIVECYVVSRGTVPILSIVSGKCSI